MEPAYFRLFRARSKVSWESNPNHRLEIFRKILISPILLQLDKRLTSLLEQDFLLKVLFGMNLVCAGDGYFRIIFLLLKYNLIVVH